MLSSSAAHIRVRWVDRRKISVAGVIVIRMRGRERDI